MASKGCQSLLDQTRCKVDVPGFKLLPRDLQESQGSTWNCTKLPCLFQANVYRTSRLGRPMVQSPAKGSNMLLLCSLVPRYVGFLGDLGGSVIFLETWETNKLSNLKKCGEHWDLTTVCHVPKQVLKNSNLGKSACKRSSRRAHYRKLSPQNASPYEMYFNQNPSKACRKSHE